MESTFDPADIPVARPSDRQSAATDDARPSEFPAAEVQPGQHPSAPKTNPLPTNIPAIIAMIAMVVAMLSIVGLVVVSATYVAELQAFEEKMGPEPDMERSQAVMEELLEENGGMVPGWFLALLFAWFSSVSSCFVGVIAGGLGLANPRNRSFAIAAMIVCGGILMLGCILPAGLSLFAL